MLDLVKCTIETNGNKNMLRYALPKCKLRQTINGVQYLSMIYDDYGSIQLFLVLLLCFI